VALEAELLRQQQMDEMRLDFAERCGVRVRVRVRVRVTVRVRVRVRVNPNPNS